jgi:hypothetical protein
MGRKKSHRPGKCTAAMTASPPERIQINGKNPRIRQDDAFRFRPGDTAMHNILRLPREVPCGYPDVLPPPHFRGIKSRLACLIGALGSALLPALPARADGENIAYDGSPEAAPLRGNPSWWRSLGCGGRCLFPETSGNPSASGNTVTVDYVPGGITNPSRVLGGLVNGGTSAGNTVDFRNGRTDFVHGGTSYHGGSTSSTATSNTVNISGGTVCYVSGGDAYS